MSVMKVHDSTNIVLPVEVSKMLGVRNGDTVAIKVEGRRVVLEKSTSSPVDEAFGIWPKIEDSAEYVNNLRNEWEERGKGMGL